jgi:cyclase
VLNSIDADGTQNGYEIALTKLISRAVPVPVVASGGGGIPPHLAEVLSAGEADAALVATMTHSGAYTVAGIKAELAISGIPVRL